MKWWLTVFLVWLVPMMVEGGAVDDSAEAGSPQLMADPMSAAEWVDGQPTEQPQADSGPSEDAGGNESTGTPTFAYAIAYGIGISHLMGSGLVWVILEMVTTNFKFRKTKTSDQKRRRRTLFTLLLTVLFAWAMLFPFIPAYPIPDVENWSVMLERLLALAVFSGLLSLGCWIQMARRPELHTLYYAVIAMLTGMVSVVFLVLVGLASPV